jgi:hypothetical protein
MVRLWNRKQDVKAAERDDLATLRARLQPPPIPFLGAFVLLVSCQTVTASAAPALLASVRSSAYVSPPSLLVCWADPCGEPWRATHANLVGAECHARMPHG